MRKQYLWFYVGASLIFLSSLVFAVVGQNDNQDLFSDFCTKYLTSSISKEVIETNVKNKKWVKEQLNYMATIDQMVNIGGFSLRIRCTGMDNNSGSTVVLDSGLLQPGTSWLLVQREVEKFARVCSYDRAGQGLSDLGPNPRTSKKTAEELQTLLQKSKIEGPYLLVGHSLGGINIINFAALYPNDVYGLILVDSAHPDIEDAFASLPLPKLSFKDKIIQFLKANSKYINYLFYRSDINAIPKPDLFTEEEWRYHLDLMLTYKHFIAVQAQSRSFDDSLLALKKIDFSIGNKPLVIITAGKPFEFPGADPAYNEYKVLHKKAYEIQKQFRKLSTNSRHIIAHNCDHMIHEEEPEIIINTIKEIIRGII